MRGRGRSASTPLTGRVALITGTLSTTGVATARLLVDEGARVALTASPSASGHLDALAAQLRETGGQILVLPADLGTRARACALIRRAVEEWGRLDILVVADGYNATAGALADGATALPRLGTPHPAVRDLLHVAMAALPQMERQGGGDIVVVAPVAGHALRAGVGGLASARIALEVAALCDNLRRRGGSRGVRVAVIEPDGLASEPDAHNPASLTAEDVAEAILYVLTRPPRVSIAELLIWPTNQPA